MRGRLNGTIKSLKTKWSVLNKAGIDGLDFGTINTIAASSGVGKTSIANQIVFSAADLNPDLDLSILFFTVEMEPWRLVARYASHVFKVPVQTIMTNPKKYMKRMDTEIRPKLKEMDIQYVSDMHSPAQINKIVQQFCTKRLNRKILIIYDHSLLIRLAPGVSEREALVEMAKEFNISKKQFPNAMFFILSQLNRDIEKPERIKTRSLHFPIKGDIFASDALFQVSDVVLVMHDPSRLQIQKYGIEGYPTEGVIFMHLLKVREGGAGHFVVKNHVHINDFPDLTLNELSNYGFMKKTVNQSITNGTI